MPIATPKIIIGTVFRMYDPKAEHFKFYIIVGDKSGILGTVYINTEVRYGGLAASLQATQLPLSCDDHSFLEHDSFADCSTVKELDKTQINAYLQKHKGHYCGHLPDGVLSSVIDILKRSKVLERHIKEKFGFTQ